MALQQPLGMGALGQDGESDPPPEDGGGYFDEQGNWCDAWSCDGGSGWGDGGGDGGDGGNDPYNFTFDDGSTWSMDPNTGDTTYYDASDGSYYTEFADGGYQFDFADGESYYEGPDGSWTDSASGCYGNADGSGGCDDGSTWGPNGEPTNVKDARAKAKQKVAEAQGKSAGAPTGGGGSSGGGKGQQQNQATQAAMIAACTAKGGTFNPMTGKCDMASLTADAWLKKNFGFGTGAAIAIIASLLIVPTLLKKL